MPPPDTRPSYSYEINAILTARCCQTCSKASYWNQSSYRFDSNRTKSRALPNCSKNFIAEVVYKCPSGVTISDKTDCFLSDEFPFQIACYPIFNCVHKSLYRHLVSAIAHDFSNKRT